MKKLGLILSLFALVMFFGCTKEETTETQKKVTATESTQELTPVEAKAIAKEAYVYGLPMVVNYKTMFMYTLAIFHYGGLIAGLQSG